MNEKSEKIIKAFHEYKQTGHIENISGISAEDLESALDDLVRFKDDWFYPMIERRLKKLQEGTAVVKEKEKPKGFLKRMLW